MLKVKRIYEPASPSDGYRILVDRLWPRGIKKQDARIDKWLKEIAPSHTLRKWFNHDPEKWNEFLVRYRLEIRDSAALRELQTDIREHETVTLLFSARNERQNQAAALLSILKGV